MEDNKVLEILLELQSNMNKMNDKIDNGFKEINKRLDKIEFKMNDGFETLEALSENNSIEITKLKVKMTKIENRIKEINTIN